MCSLNVLITGGAGYIGSHVAWAFLDRGDRVIILDNLATGVRANVPEAAVFVKGDITDRPLLESLFARCRIDAIVHCAGSTVVPESVINPLKYYHNNALGPCVLLEAAAAHDVGAILFSSTAAVYGVPQTETVEESHPLAPASPYGASKLMFEQILADGARAHGYAFANLRYFNVAGADPLGRTGQSTPKATHLIKVCAEVATGKRAELVIFGADYATPDGTCIRDYIHVTDLATAHLGILDHIRATGRSVTLNCGYSQGFSVLEVVAETARQTGAELPVRYGARRPGDVPRVVADSARLRKTIDWTPRHHSLATMIGDALRWERTAG